MSWYEFANTIVEDLRNSGEEVITKEIKPINSSTYKTKARRPLNSRLLNK